ncbi:MAG: amidohydrolase family protein [Polyangiales bacterium]
MSSVTRTFRADAVLVGDGTMIRDGAVVMDGERVIEVGTGASLGGERVRGVLMPGLVNAHTHLELSGLRGKTPTGGGFGPWLAALQKARSEELEEERDEAIDRGVASMLEAGVVAVGEVTNTLVAWPRLARRFRGVVWHEVFSLDRTRGLAQVAGLAAQRDAIDPGLGTMRWVPTPHALYSTHPDVVRALMQLGEGPRSIHLAEHAAERAFLAEGRGPIAEFYASRGLDFSAFPVPHKDPLSAARELDLVRAGVALVHLADARADELAGVEKAIAILCPRSNLHIETRLPPLPTLRAAGIPIALGTDSLASSPSLDPLAEARALADRFPDVPASFLISAATHGGARALGLDDMGLLAKGFAPGLLLVEGSLPNDVDPSFWVLRSLSLPRRRLA